MNNYRIEGRFNRPYEVWTGYRKIATCPTKRFAELVSNGLQWMEGEAGEINWSEEVKKP